MIMKKMYQFESDSDFQFHLLNFKSANLTDEDHRELWGEILRSGFDLQYDSWIINLDISGNYDSRELDHFLVDILYKIFRTYSSRLGNQKNPVICLVAEESLRQELLSTSLMKNRNVRFFQDNMQFGIFNELPEAVKFITGKVLVH